MLEPDAACASRSVHAAFEEARLHYGSHAFLSVPEACSGGPVSLTYEEAGTAVQVAIGAYECAGYGRGHHVALLLESRAEFYIHWLALNAIGATLVPLGAELVPAEMAYILQHADVDLLVHLAEREPTVASVRAILPGLATAAVAGTHELRLSHAADPCPAGDMTDQAAIVFTSGSTGRPKGCVLSNTYFLTFGRWYRDLGGRCDLRRGCERVITPLPPNHVNALAFSSMGMIMTGGCIVQLDRFRSASWWETVAASGATVMHYLGVMPAMLLQLPRSAHEREHKLRFGIGGGVRGEHHRAFEERFGVPLIEAWAMTETGGAGTISTHTGPRHIGEGCIGQPSPRYSEATILDEAGNTLPPGQIGELAVRASSAHPRKGFFSGYYKDAEATEAAWAGGWLHSGDLARRGSDGGIFFVGRRKQIIRRSGENISAAEVESALASDTRVKQVAVVPVPDPIREEEVFACIVPNPGISPGRDAVEAMMTTAAAALSYFKLPGYIWFATELPTTSTQKLRYGAIGELARSRLSQGDPALFDVREMKRRYRPAP